MSVAATYNGYSLPNIFDKFYFAHDYRNMTFRCTFLITASNASGLISACDSAEDALREPFENFTLTFGGSSEYSFNHDDNTGLLTTPRISKIQNNLSNETSRPYEFELTCQLPADKSGFNFRRDASFDVKFDSSNRRIVTFNFVYTAGSSSSSIANFNSHAATYANSVLTALTGNFEQIHKSSNTEHEQKITSGTLIYQEILDNETEAALSDPEITNARCQYSVDFEQTVGVCNSANFQAVPAVTISLTYSANINKLVVAAVTDIETVYREKVKPWIIAHASEILGLGNFPNAGNSYIIQSDRHAYDPTSFTISGHIVFTAPKTLTSIISINETITNNVASGTIPNKIWDGQADTYSFTELGSSRRVTRVIEIAKLNTKADTPPALDPTAFKLLESARTDREFLRGVGTTDAASETVQASVFISNIVENYLFMRQVSPISGLT